MSGLFAGTPLERPVTCEHCGRPHTECACPRGGDGKVKLPRDQHPRVRREKRRGNWNTIVAGLDPAATDLKALLKSLKSKLGTGGGLSEDRAGAVEVMLQGDHREAVVDWLRAAGYQAKASGG